MTILQPQDPKKIEQPSHNNLVQSILNHDFLSLAFRSFFLLAAAFSIASVGIWVSYLLGFSLVDNQTLSPVVWHVHEMIFGFAATVAVGFVLTAAQTWTKLPSLSKGWIILLIALWLLVRAGLYINSPEWVTASIVAQGLWWLIVLGAFSRLLINSRNSRNYVLAVVMALIATLNMGVIASHLLFESPMVTLHFARTAVLVFVILMGFMGGRVIPFFTASGARIAKPETPQWLTPVVTVVSLCSALLYFVSYFIELPFTPASVMLLAGTLHLWRLSFWKTSSTIKIPLLWSLHLSYAFMGLGMMLLGISYFTPSLAFSDALHMVTIGAMGLMIFAMMSRVSLGHTGRALMPNGWVNVVFILIALAAVTRVSLAVLNFHVIAWLISAACWMVASIIFVVIYAPVLWRNPPSR